MAVTFDDLPAHGERPPAMTRLDIAQSVLKTLRAEQMPPVYGFINGVRTIEDPVTLSVLNAWRKAGQPLGNHTWAHEDLEAESAAQFEADAVKNEPLLKQLMPGEDWHWLRYPYLHEGETLEKHRAVRRWLSQHGYKVAEVNMEFEDYLWNDPYARCMAKHDDAAVRMLHDTYLRSAEDYYTAFRELSERVYGRDVRYILLLHLGAFDAHMLPELLAMYRAKGISFISLPEAAADPAYADDPDVAYQGGGAQLEYMAVKRGLRYTGPAKPYKQLEALCR